MKNTEKLKELNLQYKLLRKNGMVANVELQTNIGSYAIKNQIMIGKILDLLIHESQSQIESEVNI
jgi:hypothetical protein